VIVKKGKKKDIDITEIYKKFQNISEILHNFYEKIIDKERRACVS